MVAVGGKGLCGWLFRSSLTTYLLEKDERPLRARSRQWEPRCESQGARREVVVLSAQDQAHSPGRQSDWTLQTANIRQAGLEAKVKAWWGEPGTATQGMEYLETLTPGLLGAFGTSRDSPPRPGTACAPHLPLDGGLGLSREEEPAPQGVQSFRQHVGFESEGAGARGRS